MNSEATSFFPGTLAKGQETSRIEVRQAQIAKSESWGQTGQPVGLSDETLLERLSDGHREALAILFRRYARLVRALAFRVIRDASEAEDLLQEVFLFIFRKSTLFDGSRGSARSWILQVTYTRAIDRRRHLISRRFYTNLGLEDPLIGAADSAFYEQTVEGTLGKAMLKKIDEALSEDQRRTIQLYFFEGYTLEEIAGRTGQSLGNVRNHYYRGLERMRQIIFAAKLQEK